MTAHYEVTKMYHRNKEITCCAESLSRFNSGSRDSIDVLVGREWIPYRPPIKQYGNYVALYRVETVQRIISFLRDR